MPLIEKQLLERRGHDLLFVSFQVNLLHSFTMHSDFRIQILSSVTQVAPDVRPITLQRTSREFDYCDAACFFIDGICPDRDFRYVAV